MDAFIIVRDLLMWMYFAAPLQFLRIWADITWFLYHFFSIRLLIATLFSKWKQMGETRAGRGFFEKYFIPFVINSLMRVIGFMVRSVVVVFGVMVILAVILAGAVVFTVWFFTPAVIVIMFVAGARMLFL